MAFDILLNKPASESELIDQLAAYLQKNFFELHGGFYFLKVDFVDEKRSQIAWAQSFSTGKEFGNFYYDTKRTRCYSGVKTEGPYLKAIMCAFSSLCEFSVTRERVEIEYKEIHPCDPSLESFDQPPRELIEGAFGDLADQLERNSKRNKAV